MECELDNITIYYELYGDGYPVLNLHGWPIDHRIMKGCIEPIFKTRPNYKRIYFDLPGMGKTKGEDWIEGIDDYLKIIIEFIEKIIPNENFILVGESYGCYLARGLIKKKQNLIDGVLFLVPVILPYEEQRDLPEPSIIVKDESLNIKLSAFEREMYERAASIINQKVLERGKKEWISGFTVADMAFLEKIRENHAFSFNVDLFNDKFTKPALFLLGRQDSAVGYRDALNIIENYPRATFAILDTAGHLLQIEQEESFNILTKDWLDRVEHFLKKKPVSNNMRYPTCYKCDCSQHCSIGIPNKELINCPIRSSPDIQRKAIKMYQTDKIIKKANIVSTIVKEQMSMPRLQDTLEFARGMGYKKIGIASCASLQKETKITAEKFTQNGFEVSSVCCQTGGDKKTNVDTPEDFALPFKKGYRMDYVTCNPVAQALLLNNVKTDLNLIIGLCIGHDITFTRLSDAPVSTLIAKDRIIHHNPAATLEF